MTKFKTTAVVRFSEDSRQDSAQLGGVTYKHSSRLGQGKAVDYSPMNGGIVAEHISRDTVINHGLQHLHPFVHLRTKIDNKQSAYHVSIVRAICG